MLALLALGGCWTGSTAPVPPPPPATPTVLAPGAAYAPLFATTTLTFPAKTVIRRAGMNKTLAEPLRCEISEPEPDRGVLACASDVRLPDWRFRRDEHGLWLDNGDAPVRLMQAVPERALLPQSEQVWDIEVRVKSQSGAWCTHYAWAGESTVGSWNLCLRDGQLVGGHYTVERDDGRETVAFGEGIR